MKRIIAILTMAVLVISSLAACGSNSETNNSNDDNKKTLKIVTTIFPEYDWVREILGENLEHTELTMLLDNGVDLHSYQPSVDDILKISTCDMFIYVGGESDEWVQDALKEAANKDMIVINLLDVIGDRAKTEEIIEGMQGEEHEHAEDDDHEESEGHEGARIPCFLVTVSLFVIL